MHITFSLRIIYKYIYFTLPISRFRQFLALRLPFSRVRQRRRLFRELVSLYFQFHKIGDVENQTRILKILDNFEMPRKGARKSPNPCESVC